MNWWMKEWIGGRRDEWVKGWIEGWTGEWKDEWNMEGWKDDLMNLRMNRLMEGINELI